MRYKVKATPRQKIAIAKYIEMGQANKFMALVEAGYSPNTAKTPDKVFGSRGFQELLETELPDSMLLQTHKDLMKSTRIDHMVFPLGPKDDDDINMSGPTPNAKNPMDQVKVERTTLTDAEITAILAEVGAKVRRIVHGQTARHVYFWVANDKARQDALKLAYEIKGKTKVSEPPASNNTYNTFIQNNQIDPNAPSARRLAESTLKVMMDETKRIKDAGQSG